MKRGLFAASAVAGGEDVGTGCFLRRRAVARLCFLLAMGVHAKIAQELLGHSNIAITLNIYSNVLPSLQKDAVDKLSSLFDRQEDHENDAQKN